MRSPCRSAVAWGCLLDASSSCPQGDRRSASTASFTSNARCRTGAGVSLWGHQDTVPQRLLEPSTSRSAAVDLSDDKSSCVFISFSLLHPGRCKGQRSSLAPGLPAKGLQSCPSKPSLPEGEQCWALRAHAERAQLGDHVSPQKNHSPLSTALPELSQHPLP